MDAATQASGSRDRVASALLCAVIGVSALAGGGVHTPVLLALSLTLIAAMLCIAAPLRAGRFAGVLFVLCGVTVLQALPMPIAMLSVLSHQTADIWLRAGESWGESIKAASLSLAPGATLIEALRLASYALVAALAATLAARRGPWGIVSAVALSGASAALVTLVIRGFDLRSLFGVYEPRFAEHPLPIMSTNSLSGYLNLATFACFGLIQRTKHEGRLLLLAGSATLCLGTVLLLASRGAVAAFALGAVLAGLWIARQASLPFNLKKTWVILGSVLTALMLFLLAARATTWNELLSTSWFKLRVFAGTLAMIRDNLWFGVGRGAFETAYPPYQPSGLYTENVVVTHPENVLLQGLSEWGIVVTLLAIFGFAVVLRPKIQSSADRRPTVWVLTGVGVVLLQNLVDLGTEIPALPIALCALLAGLFVAPDPDRASLPTQAWLRHMRPLLVGTGTALIAALLVLKPAKATDLRSALYSRAGTVTDSKARESFLKDLSSALHQYPGDPYLWLLSAHVWRGYDERRATASANRALERNPRHGPAHLFIAEQLWSRQAAAQAMLQLRLAIQAWPSLVQEVANRINTWTHEPTLIERAAPEGRLGAELVSTVAMGESSGIRSQLISIALERDPQHARSHLQAAELAVEALASDRCSGPLHSACIATVEDHLREAQRGGALQVAQVEARFRAALADPVRGWELLEMACPADPDPPSCWRTAEAIARTVSRQARHAAMASFVASSCSSASTCAAALQWAGQRYQESGDWPSALQHFRRAVEQEPNAARWLQLANAAEQAGALHEAQRARQQARQ